MFARAAAFALLSLSVVPLLASAFDPSGPSPARRDRWSREEIAILQTLRLSELPPPPADPSNAAHAKPAAAALGKRLFFEARFSRDQTVSCATCHAPERQFQDDRALGRGLGVGTRRTMPIVGAAFSPWLFWDGRKDSLWSQALGPLEDPAEHATNRTRIAHLVREHHRADYEAAFGTMPDLAGLPRDASPLGTPDERAAWDAMDARSRQDVSRVFANVGKAIAAYERTLAFGPSRFDHYVQGVLSADATAQAALTVQEVRGLRLFLGAGQCATCHNGPLLTDQHFHNTGVAPRDRARPDTGRADAVSRVQRDEFNCLGPFSDAKPAACEELRFIVADDPAMLAAFKTPSLRNVALRAPYMHAGQLATLEEVVGHYALSPPAAAGHSELARDTKHHAERRPIRLSKNDQADLVAFLRTLSGPIVERN
jgi:cytochrome c peroxidase